jgi:Cysteine-rich CPXCG
MRFAFDHDSEDDSQDFDLDRDFPLGDGTADVAGSVVCPYCGEPNEVSLDPGSGEVQEYVEDCQVCCKPWKVVVHYNGDGSASVTAIALDG